MPDIDTTLGFSFHNTALLEEALTHSSTTETRLNYERLEFLGDAILKLVLTEALYKIYPDKTEGELSSLRAILASDILLGRKARDLGIAPFIHVSGHEEALRHHERILGDVLEALFGALYLDQGLDTVRTWILTLYKDALEGTEDLSEFQDHKTALQEITQARTLGQPTYTLRQEEGPVHDRRFTIEASILQVGNTLTTTGTGRSKKQAEQLAAKALLGKL